MIDGDPIDCAKCGEPHTRCTAHTRAGKPCQCPRMIGQTVCRMHGGAAPHARKAGLQRRALEEADKEFKALIAHKEGEGITDPLLVMAKLAEEALAMKDKLAMRVNALQKIRYRDDKGGEQLRSEVVLYERALDRSAKFVEMMARSGFEAARVRLDQQKGLLVAHVLKKVLEQLSLSPEQQRIAFEIIPIELRKLEGKEKDK